MKCKRCAVEKELVWFLKKKSGTRMDICKVCHRAARKKEQDKHKPKPPRIGNREFAAIITVETSAPDQARRNN